MKQHFSRLCSLCLTIGALLSPAAHALTVYTAGPANLINALGEGFKKETGITVDVFQADTGKVMARLEAEAANPRADVVISASWESALDLDKRGWLLHWQSANAASVPAVYKGPAYVAQGLSALAIVWNPKSGTPLPTDWSDLAKAEFKDKVNMPDPASSGTALELLSGLQTAQGDKAWKLFEALKANGMAVGGANAAALNPVLQGAKAAVFGAVDYVTLGAVAKGEAVEVIFPSSGTIVAARPMMILKSSKAQDDAKKFIDYVLSPQGQALVAEVFLMPARSDVAAKRKPASEIKVLPAEGEGAQAARKALLERFSALFGRK